MTYDILITTFKKSKSEILNLLNTNHIFGNIYVGNQGSDEEGEERLQQKKQNIHIYNMTSVGVSKNRNFLLTKAKSDFVLFLDDDVKIINYDFAIDKFSTEKAYRYNLISNNNKRPIKQINKNDHLHFRDLKSFGVWGIFFPRILLLKQKILFNETIGPGCLINHGEDSLFIKNFLNKNQIVQINSCNFLVNQTVSTWQGENRNIKIELISHGYVYGLLFGRMAKLFLYYYLIKNRTLFRTEKNTECFRLAKKGLKLYKTTNNKEMTDENLKNIINKELNF